MNETPLPQFDELVDGTVNEDAIRNYLDPNLVNLIPSTVAKSSKRDATDSIESVADAVTHAAEAIGQTHIFREKLLLGMNINTLLELLYKIGYNLVMLSQDPHLFESDDPIKGPVFAMIQRRLPNLPKDPAILDVLHIENIIKTASERTQVAKPTLPCNLEPALLWAANIQTGVSSILLRKAFRSYLMMPDVSTENDVFLNNSLSECNSRLQSLRGDPNQIATLKKLQKEKKEIKAELMYVRSIISNSYSFDLRKAKPPKHVVDRAERVLVKYFSESGCIEMESTLADFAVGFHAFWQKHGHAFLKRALAKSKSNSASGTLGPTSRMKARWMARATDFVKFCEGKDIPDIVSDKWDDFLVNYTEKQPEKQRTKKIIAAFIKTLIANQDKATTDEQIYTLIELLKRESITAVDPETIRQCLNILNGDTARGAS